MALLSPSGRSTTGMLKGRECNRASSWRATVWLSYNYSIDTDP